MTVRRLYVPDLPEAGGPVTLAEAPSRHVRVLRLRAGDEVVLFDGKGHAAPARLESIGDAVVCQAELPRTGETSRARVVLLLAVPKGSKLDDCVRMATELGVDEVGLMYTPAKRLPSANETMSPSFTALKRAPPGWTRWPRTR
jgi:16S rRNA (uracil1498-N3)-methyltransferase